MSGLHGLGPQGFSPILLPASVAINATETLMFSSLLLVLLNNIFFQIADTRIIEFGEAYCLAIDTFGKKIFFTYL